MSEQAPREWQYDLESEELRDRLGSCIGRIEPASGPLAAAAPDLLEACKQIALAADCRGHGKRRAREHGLYLVRAAIAKAEGDPNGSS